MSLQPVLYGGRVHKKEYDFWLQIQPLPVKPDVKHVCFTCSVFFFSSGYSFLEVVLSRIHSEV